MQVLNSSLEDIDLIFHFYDLAVDYQKTKFDKHWLPFDQEMVKKEIVEKRQFKILEGDQVACVFAITDNDPHIWKERNSDRAVYIHRIVTHPAFRGRNYVKLIVEWAKDYARANNLDYIRMDTWGDNNSLINYYTSCGFEFLGIIVPDPSDELPSHYSAINLSLFEIKILEQ
jgi:ribosomal protein S18 acetylase RimI-like enzyme